ncbi:MAG: glutathione S-transferase N-terminal domain-containing protein [Sphingopyxis sp.]|nr:glutathione S-transferase N-terminal domain-containing protein [Sphingopyxis sp.]
MKLYQSVGPNPRVVLFFLAEKGIEIAREFVDIRAGDNRAPAWLARNPRGAMPLLELDDGSLIGESTAICEYLEELHPDTPLIGATVEARAATRSALRYIDHSLVCPMTNGFRSAEGLEMFQDRMLCVPEAAAGNKAYAQEGLARADRMVSGRPYLAGEAFSLADIVLFCWSEFGAMVGQAAPEALTHFHDWRARVAARPAASASADPKIGIDA